MKTLVVYGTKYGFTEGCANLLKNKLPGEIDLCNLMDRKPTDLGHYDMIIIGGSIHMGRIQKEVTEFCQSSLEILKNKKIGLFVCCMRDGEMAESQIKASFPTELLEKALAKEYFGGEFIFKKMSFLDKLIVKKVAKVKGDTTNLLKENINKFSEALSRA